MGEGKTAAIEIKYKQNKCCKFPASFTKDYGNNGNNRQWITLVLNNLPLKNLYINAKAGGESRDRDDIKLIIDGEIQKNPSNKSPKYTDWYWAGNLLAGQPETFNEELNLSAGLHYIELWADKMPALEKIRIVLEEKKKEAEEDQKILEETQEPQKRIPTVDNPEWTGDFNDDTEQMILARAIFGEARNTLLSDEARFAVGWTIRNRVEMQTWWGKNYHEVILKPDHYSCFTKTDKNYKLVADPLSAKSIVDKKTWPKCYEIAGKILNNEISDPVNGATCYHDISISQERFTTKDVPGAKFIKKIDRLMFYYSPN